MVTYCCSLACFALGLMAKPMLVSLPPVLLLLDYWPLKRFKTEEQFNSGALFRKRIIEKIPFLLLAAASCIVTLAAQKNAMTSLINSPLTDRIANAAVSSVIYLSKTVVPVNLSVFYPFPDSIPAWKAIAAGTVVAAITAAVYRQRARYPYLLTGWLWYLITLAPVIGIVRVGLQAMADRYTYIPLIGIFIITVWGISDLVVQRWKL